VKHETIKKVVVLGPESTGKSTLCAQLAAHFDTVWVPEYARAYLETNGMDYTYENLLTIARGQLAGEDKLVVEARHQLLIIDTDLYVMKVWCEFVFGKCHAWIDEQIAARHYDLYLLCAPDLPWAYDPLREYPDAETRQRLYEIYKQLLMRSGRPWVNITGDDAARLQKAGEAITTRFFSETTS
jgi:NadR type nicotinamide-nucleotide adenylyltransferase